MLDNMDMHDREELNRRDEVHGRPAGERPLADREVPLNAHPAADSAETINQWLDGETSEEVALSADARQVQFWHAINAETGQRRRMKTPAHVMDAIMNALPEASADTVADVSPQMTSRLSLSPAAAAAAAAGFTALGVLIGRVIGR